MKSSLRWLAVVAVFACMFIYATAAQANDAFWTTGNGNWSTQNAASLGWAGPLPDAVGDSANWNTTGKSSITTTQDLAGSRTVGKIEATGTANASWQITLNTGKNLILNQDGAGPGTAVISDAQTTGSNSAILINGGTGIITLNDDLLISNTGGAARAGGSIEIDPQFQGAGNITFYSVSNTIGSGHIALFRIAAGASSFTGNSTIAKGAVTFSRGDRFSPVPSNVITIGRSDGDATLEYANTSLGNMENNFATSATAGGTLVFGTTNAATGLVNIKTSNTNAASFTLNGDLSFTSGTGVGGLLQIGDPITGVGRVTKIGAGAMRVTNANSYSGGTVVNAGSLAVGHTDAIDNGFGHYDATDGTLGSGNVRVNSALGSKLEIESPLATVNVISDTATVKLAGCDSAFSCAGGAAATADGGYLQLDSGIDETVGALLLSSDGGATFVPQAPGTYGATGSGATNINDEFFSGSGILNVVSAPGDYNGDGLVNAADYVNWRKSDGTDSGYANWRENFGNGSPAPAPSLAGPAAVPEPSTLVLFGLVSLMLVGRGRRRFA